MGLRNLLLFVLFGFGAPARAQTIPDISHDPLDCIGVGKYPVVDAAIKSGRDIQIAKVYFRSDKYPRFYWVEMVIHDGKFIGILPKPGPDTQRVIYYIEAVDVAYNEAVDVEHDPQIREKCEERIGTAYLPGEEPGIIIGATEAGAPAIPPGFETAGIIATVATTGVTTGIGGGTGVGTVVAVGAGAAAAGVGAVAVATGTSDPDTQDDSTTNTGNRGGTGPAPTSPRTSTTTVPGTTTAPGTTTVPGTTTAPGTTTVPGTTTAPATTTSSAPPPGSVSASCGAVTVCFQVRKLATCIYEFDGSCSSSSDGPILSYSWQIDKTGALPPGQIDVFGPNPSTTVDWNMMGGCSGQSIEVLLDVKDASNNCAVTDSGYVINQRTLEHRRMVETSFVSFLGIPPYDETARGQVKLNNGRVDATSNASPFVHTWRGADKENTVEALTILPFDGEGFWKFDFSAAKHFVASSLKIEQGQMISRDTHSIVFRLSGASGERIKFTYRLAR